MWSYDHTNHHCHNNRSHLCHHRHSFAWVKRKTWPRAVKGSVTCIKLLIIMMNWLRWLIIMMNWLWWLIIMITLIMMADYDDTNDLGNDYSDYDSKNRAKSIQFELVKKINMIDADRNYDTSPILQLLKSHPSLSQTPSYLLSFLLSWSSSLSFY